MEKTRFAVFIDIENAGGKESVINNIIEKVKIRGDILIGKVYGYTDRYSSLKECLLSNTFSVVPSLRHGKSQKNSLDIQLVIDAMEVAYTNPLIDSFCIVSGDSDYMPLVGKLKSMGKFVLGISRSEVASGIFIKACNEFIFLESVAAGNAKHEKVRIEQDRSSEPSLDDLCKTALNILHDQDDDKMYASELKDTLTRLHPDFDERSYGCATFGKFVSKLASVCPEIRFWTEASSLLVGLNAGLEAGEPELNKSNWLPAFRQSLRKFSDDGFERINPSILKADIRSSYPGFEERQIGFKRFSDIMKELEKEKLLEIEMDEQHTMLLKIVNSEE